MDIRNTCWMVSESDSFEEVESFLVKQGASYGRYYDYVKDHIKRAIKADKEMCLCVDEKGLRFFYSKPHHYACRLWDIYKLENGIPKKISFFTKLEETLGIEISLDKRKEIVKSLNLFESRLMNFYSKINLERYLDDV